MALGVDHAIGCFELTRDTEPPRDALVGEQPQHIVDDVVDDNGFGGEASGARVVEQPAHDAIDAGDLAFEGIEGFGGALHIAGAHAKQVRVIGDRRYWIADLMRDAGRDASHGGELLDAHARLGGRRHLLGHVVDAGGQLVELLCTGRGHQLGDITAGDGIGRLHAVAERFLDESCHEALENAGREERDDEDEGHHEGPPDAGGQRFGEPHGGDDCDDQSGARGSEYALQTIMDAGSLDLGHGRRMRSRRGSRNRGNGERAGQSPDPFPHSSCWNCCRRYGVVQTGSPSGLSPASVPTPIVQVTEVDPCDAVADQPVAVPLCSIVTPDEPGGASGMSA